MSLHLFSKKRILFAAIALVFAVPALTFAASKIMASNDSMADEGAVQSMQEQAIPSLVSAMPFEGNTTTFRDSRDGNE